MNLQIKPTPKILEERFEDFLKQIVTEPGRMTPGQRSVMRIAFFSGATTSAGFIIGALGKHDTDSILRLHEEITQFIDGGLDVDFSNVAVEARNRRMEATE